MGLVRLLALAVLVVLVGEALGLPAVDTVAAGLTTLLDLAETLLWDWIKDHLSPW